MVFLPLPDHVNFYLNFQTENKQLCVKSVPEECCQDPETLSPLIEQKNYRYLEKTHRYLKYLKNSASFPLFLAFSKRQSSQRQQPL
jgi:hypothetical protein